jgi:hypothetical protein
MWARVSREVWIGLGTLLAAGGAASGAEAAPLDTEAFVAACISDPVVTDEPGLAQGSKVTPKIYCDCIAGKLGDKKLSQADVDMLTKLHKDEITDEDAESYPTLEDLMSANEGIEDDCKASLGMPPGADDDEEAPPVDEEDIPQDE